MSFRKIGISLFSVLAAQQSFGVDWDGGPSGTGIDFNLPANWDGDVFPGSTGTARFTDVGHDGSPGFDVSSLSSSITVGSLDFNSTKNWRIQSGSANVLTVESVISNSGSGRIDLNGSFSSPGDLDIVIGFGSRRIRLQNGSLVGSGNLSITGGQLDLDSSFSINGYSQTSILSGAVVVRVGADIGGIVDIQSTADLRFIGNTSAVSTVSGVSGSGDWVFDLAANSDVASAFVDVTGTADIGSLTLDLRNNPSTGDMVLASYGTLTGGQFANVIGLGPGQSINYNYGPNGDQIALVPEVSLASPLLAAFLPLFALRRRNRRK